MFEEPDSKFDIVQEALGRIETSRVESIVRTYLRRIVKETVRKCVYRQLSHEETFNSVAEKLQSLMPAENAIKFSDKLYEKFKIDARAVKDVRVHSVSTLGEIQDCYIKLASMDQKIRW